ncbi:MAG: glycine-rich protein [Polyangiaceae bacterium]
MRRLSFLPLLTLTATGALLAACGAPDRTFDPPDVGTSNPMNDASSGNDAGSDQSTTPDQAGGGDTRTDIPTGDTATDQRVDGGSDARIDSTVDAPSIDATADLATPDNAAPDSNDGGTTPDNWTPDTGADVAADAGSDATEWDANDAGAEFDCNTVPAPTVTPNGTINLCPGKTATLTSSTAVSYSWSNGMTTQSIDVTGAGSYSVTTTEGHGCTGTSAATTVNMYPAPPTATVTAGGPTRFCQGGLVTLTANSAASYIWNTGATTQSIQVNTSGAYTVTTTDVNGCPSTSTPISVEVVIPAAIDVAFGYSGALVNWVVPECVTQIEVDAYGAQGGSHTNVNYGKGGLGGQVKALLNTTPGTTLQIRVGGVGTACSISNVGGFNGGGVANCSSGTGGSATGGGATDVRITPYSLYERVIVAGGGGGSGANCSSVDDSGGVGGGITGGRWSATCSNATAPGFGGTQSGGGAGGTYVIGSTNYGTAGYGGWGVGGSGVSTGGTSTPAAGGGGGGGYYGGGGGCWAGGGGGSDYIRTSVATMRTSGQNPGVRAGHGALTIKFPPPP